jgi:hypothetical protein
MKILSTLIFISMMVIPTGYVDAVVLNSKLDVTSKPVQNQVNYSTISVRDLFFYNRNTRINILSLSRSNFQKLLGKPKRIQKGYSEMDDDHTITYSYPDGEFVYYVKQNYFYIEVKGPGWAFGIREKNGAINKFSPGNTLEKLKEEFPESYNNPVSSIYVNLAIKTPEGIVSDSPLTFEVDKSRNKIVRIYFD